MANTHRLKRSATAGAVPTTAQLSLGELAINTRDGKMYLKKNDGGDPAVETIVQIGGSVTIASAPPAGAGIGDGADGYNDVVCINPPIENKCTIAASTNILTIISCR